jgi:hypothetical protein
MPAPPSGRDDWKARAEAAIHSKWNICVDVQMVAMEEAKALDLIPDLQSEDRTKVEGAWAKIQAMIKAKEAILMGWPMVRSVDGMRSVSESIVEQRYPTEFEPQLPLVSGNAAPPPPGAPAEKPVMKNAIPTAFETRNVGVMLEVVATVLDEGRRVHLEIEPQRVELLEMEKNESVLANGKIIMDTPQPLFGRIEETQSLTLANGQRQLIGVHALAKPANYIELHLVRAVVTKSE